MPIPLIRMWFSVTSNNVTICLKQPQLFHVHSMHCKNKQTNKKTIRVTLINNVLHSTSPEVSGHARSHRGVCLLHVGF